MYEIRVELEFSAAHFHPKHQGKCRQLHGHNYKVLLYVRARELDELGMVCDFLLVKKTASVLLEEFDHSLLNDHSAFAEIPPSSENLAKYFFERLQLLLDKDNHWLHAVEVRESDKTAAIFIKD